MSTVGERIREALEDAGLEPADLVKRLGMTRTAVKYWLDGTTKHIRPEHLFPAAKALQVSPEWLGTGQGEKRPSARGAEQTSAYVVQHLSGDEQKLLSAFSSLSLPLRRALLALVQEMTTEERKNGRTRNE